MPQFRVKVGSMSFCGYDEERIFESESEETLCESREYKDFIQGMEEYISADITEDMFEDYGDEVYMVDVFIEEI